MDIHVVDFLKASYEPNNTARHLLLWLLLSNRNNKKKINQLLYQQASKKGSLDRSCFGNWLSRYDRFEKRKDNRTPFEQRKRTLNSLQINNFRGFCALTDEDKGAFIKFHPEINIFFAPNGGGKTSLCEALEYICTGTIKEAERRKTSISKYIKRNGKLFIDARNNKGELVEKTSSNLFCFIDRNRLQEFSLLGSNDTGFGQRDVLASLVGLERLDEFLTKLVQPTSFDVERLKVLKNIQKEKDILGNISIVKKRHKELQKNIRIEIHSILGVLKAKKLSERYAGSFTKSFMDSFDIKVDYYIGKRNGYSKGKLVYLISFDKTKKFITYTLNLLRFLNRLNYKQSLVSDEIEYYHLYDMAESILKKKVYHECPLCRTSLDEVNVDPLDNAQECLRNLKKISRVVKRKEELISKLGKCVEIIKNEFEMYRQSPIKDEDILTESDFSVLLDLKAADFDSIKKVSQLILDRLSQVSKIEKHNEKGKLHNKNVSESDLIIKKLDAKISDLKKQKEKISECMANIRSMKSSMKKDASQIRELFSQLPNIKLEVMADIKRNDFLDVLKDNYSSLYFQAFEFKKNREQSIISGLNKDIVNYYNMINYHSDKSEIIDDLYFTYEDSSKQYRIKTIINGTEMDAFVFLSEGHLKVLGLAILLALAKKKELSFIIFDDVVNAIDTEHRSNIINTFLTDGYIKNTQLIITTHDRFFWEMFSNKCKEFMLDLKTYVLGCDNGSVFVLEKKISFEDKIEESLKFYDVRQALIYCRIWFESLATKYCVDLSLEITGNFSSRDFQNPNMIRITLESMYAALLRNLNGRHEQVNIIKKDLLNWSMQNQEHHAFNENSYNIVHSKTSHEIKNIFEAIRKFEIQLSPSTKLKLLNERIGKIKYQIIKCEELLNNDKVPDDIKFREKERHSYLLSLYTTIVSLRQFAVSEIFC